MSKIQKALGAALAVSMLGLAGIANAVTMQIGDHGDGALGPDYGLRLDRLNGAANGPSFSILSATVTWDATDPSVHAVLTGTLQSNTPNASTWSFSYTVTGTAGGDITLNPGGVAGFIGEEGFGTMTLLAGDPTDATDPGDFDVGDTIDLGFAQKQSDPYTGMAFIFLNDGHRLPGDPGVGWVGRGWEDSPCCNDFLVKAVPLPAGVWLFGTALLGLASRYRRAKVTTA